jgi:hypothetical protein
VAAHTRVVMDGNHASWSNRNADLLAERSRQNREQRIAHADERERVRERERGQREEREREEHEREEREREERELVERIARSPEEAEQERRQSPESEQERRQSAEPEVARRPASESEEENDENESENPERRQSEEEGSSPDSPLDAPPQEMENPDLGYFLRDPQRRFEGILNFSEIPNEECATDYSDVSVTQCDTV